MNEIEAFEILRSDAVDGVGVRVNQKIAKKWLAENQSIICGGTVFFLKIKNLGLGIYKITKAPSNICETLMVQ